MRVVITGAAGFIGRKLTAALLRQGQLMQAATGSAQHPAPISELVLADQMDFAAPSTRTGNIPVRKVIGDLCEAGYRQHLFEGGVGTLFHLAASLTTEAERDIARGIETNVLSLLGLLELCRAQKTAPRFIFASSIATFGGTLPDVVDDTTAQTPQTSYGAHKVIAEQLVSDYSRHGVLDGRCLRLPIVVIRPRAGRSVSDSVAAILREPLNGDNTDCPFRPETTLPLVSIQAVVRGLLKLHDLSADTIGAFRAFNLPALRVTAAEMAAAVQAWPQRKPGQVNWRPDAQMQAIVDGWPARFDSVRARQLGILPDASLTEIIDAYLKDAP
ncbi:NAD-dependent epimerase/dehydratase family protein [Ferrovibrio sp.]|uniref:NAD-dependent epimerase/dehydratase family protein n=1 Tax=Ferrovibrio sp. TaxID=1917215 RepID=UPI000CB86DE5|nr:NAD-dependent epimerase/dehydratase family protein [Ferrovibrio sp.]PJI42075.1 MAG: NAD-dependent epimerase [Ferrovibrio sp.]